MRMSDCSSDLCSSDRIRGASFLLQEDGPRAFAPGRMPSHTLNPAMARFADGRAMVYGTMGGEGQPQTQSAVFSRYAMFGQKLQAAATADRKSTRLNSSH